MGMEWRRRGVVASMVCLAACGADATDAGPDLRTEVEAGLLPAVVLAGEDMPAWTIDERMEHYSVPGVSVAVLEGGEIAWAQGYGYADPAEGVPVSTTTLFQAASISKPVAAMAALRLVEEGRLELDAPINTFLTGWAIPDNEFTVDSVVTLRNIVTHSAGLTVWGFPGYARSDDLPTVTQVLDGSGPANTDSVRVWKVPGVSWRYSGGGYTVMQKAMEDVSGMPFPELLRTSVLEPAGMTESTYEQPLPEDRWSQAARGHFADGSEVEGEWHTYPEMAAAGLWTTPSDLARLAIEVQESLHGRANDVLSRGMTEALVTPSAHENWGLGFSIEGEGEDARFSHGGSNNGFKASFTAFKEGGRGAFIMTNGDRGSALASEIMRSIGAAYGWSGFEPEVRTAISLTEEQEAAIAGTYVVPEMELTITITAENGRYTGAMGSGEQAEASELHAASSTELFRVEDGMTMTFEIGSDGIATAVSVGDQIRAVRR